MRDGHGKREVEFLVAFISLLKQLRNKKKTDQAGFFLVNEFGNIVPFRQCLYWVCKQDGGVRIVHASGQVEVSDDSPYIRGIKGHIQALIEKHGLGDASVIERIVREHGVAKSYALTSGELVELGDGSSEEDPGRGGYDYRGGKHIVCGVALDEEGVLGGLWMDRNEKFGGIEEALVEDVTDALAVLMGRKKESAPLPLRLLRRVKNAGFALLGVLFLLGLIPVQLSVTAPAEIVSRDVEVITPPFSGLIKEVMVKPNQDVKSGQVLFTLDQTEFENDVDIARQKLLTARAALDKTEREFLGAPEKAGEISALQEQIKIRQLELDYAKGRLDQAQVKASKDGVILFSDVSDIKGQPVNAGAKIMTLANPKEVELMVRIPAQSMIDMSPEAEVLFFLNTNPLKSQDATLKTVSYQSSRDEDSLLTYKARADISEKVEEKDRRVGLTGTAKIYGEKTILFFNVFKRPLVGLRNLFGGGW